MNQCPNCGLPLLLIDSQGKRLYKCTLEPDNQYDVERRLQDSPWKTTETTLSGDIGYAVEPWNTPPQVRPTPGAGQAIVWYVFLCLATALVALVAWLWYS